MPDARKVTQVAHKTEGFVERAKAEQKRFDMVTDTNYYAVLCFETQEQRDEFFDALSSRGLVPPKRGNRYVNGLEVAKAIGVEIKSPRVTWPKQRNPRTPTGQVPEERDPPLETDA